MVSSGKSELVCVKLKLDSWFVNEYQKKKDLRKKMLMIQNIELANPLAVKGIAVKVSFCSGCSLVLLPALRIFK